MAKKKGTDKFALPKWLKEHVPEEVARSELFVFNVKLASDKKIRVNLVEDIDINFDSLEDHLEEIPAQYVFWAAIYSELKSRVTVLEMRVASRRAFLTKTTLERFRDKGIKLTDKQLTNIVSNDDKQTKLEAELAIAQKHCGKVYHMVEAIKIRSEHCRSLAGFKRQEREQSGQQT